MWIYRRKPWMWILMSLTFIYICILNEILRVFTILQNQTSYDKENLISKVKDIENNIRPIIGQMMNNFQPIFIKTTRHPKLRPVNCTAVIMGNKSEMNYVEFYQKYGTKKPIPTDEEFAHMTSDCGYFKTRHYNNITQTQLEVDFPIAYSIVVHTKPVQVERLLRAIYAPQNVYCIHVDNKSTEAFKQSMKNIQRCLPNIFIATQIVNVIYASFSRLQADINCLNDLTNVTQPWKYVINLVGQDFPIKTKYEIVKYLIELNGTNDIPGTSVLTKPQRDRFTYKHKQQKIKETVKVVQTNQLKSLQPGNVGIYSGTAFFIMSRAFVEYIHSSKIAKDLLGWFNDTYSPDENYWITVNSLQRAPGGRETPTWANRVRLVHWYHNKNTKEVICYGQWIRTICVFSLRDLPWIVTQLHLFANKFNYYIDPQAIDCLTEWLHTRAKSQITQK